MTRIMTWNVNSIAARESRLFDVLTRHKPDVLALQEIKTEGAKVPCEPLRELGYDVTFVGQKSYNGVAILTNKQKGWRHDIVATSFHKDFAQDARFIHGTCHVGSKSFDIINVYVPNGQSLTSDKYPYKLSWLAALADYLRALPSTSNTILLGGFNIVPDDIDCYDAAYYGDDVFCSKPERNALGAILATGFTDLFRMKYPEQKEFSWWDYRMLSFQKNKGLRIDLILGGESIQAQTREVVMDRQERKGDKPSDHVPVFVDLELA